MKMLVALALAALQWLAPLAASCEEGSKTSCTVSMRIDHSRMLVEAEIKGADGSWQPALLWVDTGNPSFSMSEPLARRLGYDLGAANENMLVQPPAAVRIGGMELDFQGVRTLVMFDPKWLFGAMHNDANLPSTVLQRYHVVFDYPKRLLTIAKPGALEPRGVRAPASVQRETGIVQIDATIDGDSLSFALDNGASYSYASGDVLDRLCAKHPDWPRTVGTIGCANMWGWWPPDEQTLTVARVGEMQWGPVHLTGVGIVGAPAMTRAGMSLGAWYSTKSARPVDGFLGPNAFNAYRVEIDYAGEAVYFEKGAQPRLLDMDLVGLTLRPEADGSYTIIGVSSIEGKAAVEGVEPGDKLVRVGNLETAGATMGTVIDALRGAPGEKRALLLDRGGKRFTVEAVVRRFL